MIFLILLGAEVFNAFLALTQLPTHAADMVAKLGLPPYAVMASLMLFYILLGAVMDELAMILLTLPVFFPIVQALDFGMSAGRCRDLVRHPRADRRRHRPDLPADRAQCLRRVGDREKCADPPRPIGASCPSSPPTSSGCALVLAFPALALWLVRLLS